PARLCDAVGPAITAAITGSASVAFSGTISGARRHVSTECRSVPDYVQAFSAPHHTYSKCDDIDRGGTNDCEWIDSVARWKDCRRRNEYCCAGGCVGDRWNWKIRHARNHRRALAHRRVSRARRRCEQRRKRINQSGHRQRLGRTFGLAAGSANSSGPRRRADDDADSSGVGKSDRRTQRGRETGPLAHSAGNEVSGSKIRTEDGLRREPEASLSNAWAINAHG